MYVFRLFDRGDAVTPVDARLLAEGEMRIGRDPTADWVMVDPDREISRTHLTIRIEDGELLLKCSGTNGVFDAVTEQRLPDGEDILLSPPTAFMVGRYRMVAERAAQSQAAAGESVNGTLVMAAASPGPIDVPTDWPDAPPIPPMTAGGLFDAFCDGAGIDPSAFCAEDPADILRRAGAVYRQLVLGVGDLMAERERVRARYRLTSTTIGGADNNPFKWAPSQRLAIDLLLDHETSFLSGPEALHASFRDIKVHLVATVRGMQDSLRTAIARFDPDDIAAAADGQRSMLKGRLAAQWDEACGRHRALSAELDGQPGILDRSFVRAYGAATTDTDGNPA